MPVHHGTDVLFMCSFNTNGGSGTIASTTLFTAFTAATGVSEATVESTFSNVLSAAGDGPQAGETFTAANFKHLTSVTYSGTTTTYYAGQSSAGRSVVYLVPDKSWHYSPNTGGPIIP